MSNYHCISKCKICHCCRILRRTNSANAQLGLTILLYPDTQNYAMGMNNFYGFRVLVHSPYNFPEVSGKGFAIPSKKEAFLAVSAQVTQRYCTRAILEF